MQKNKENKSAGVRSKQRDDHFKSGGSVEEWLGIHYVHANKSEKRKDRRVKRQQAIEDSYSEVTQ